MSVPLARSLWATLLLHLSSFILHHLFIVFRYTQERESSQCLITSIAGLCLFIYHSSIIFDMVYLDCFQVFSFLFIEKMLSAIKDLHLLLRFVQNPFSSIVYISFYKA